MAFFQQWLNCLSLSMQVADDTCSLHRLLILLLFKRSRCWLQYKRSHRQAEVSGSWNWRFRAEISYIAFQNLNLYFVNSALHESFSLLHSFEKTKLSPKDKWSWHNPEACWVSNWKKKKNPVCKYQSIPAALLVSMCLAVLQNRHLRMRAGKCPSYL